MNEKQICARLRREFNKPALVLLIYYGMMNVIITLAMLAEALITMITDRSITLTSALASAAQSGWGYLLVTVIGGIILLIWKKGQFCCRDIWKRNSKMKFSSFWALLCVFVSGQALFQVLAITMEWFLNLYGLSVMKSMEMATVSTDSISMFLYVSLLAPVFEEILFRGVILRTLEPFGKKFAILTSAFLFGIFHGNPVQSPYAFAVGLVLGYVTVEYSMGWAVIMHLINNLVLGDVLPRLMNLLPDIAGEFIWFGIIWGCAVGALIIMLVNRKKIAHYLSDGKIHPLCMKSFVTSPGVLVLTGLMSASMILMLFLQ